MDGPLYRVVDSRGEEGTLVSALTDEPGAFASVRLASGEQVHIDSRLLRSTGEGYYRLATSFAELRTAGTASGLTGGGVIPEAGVVHEEIVPISEETLQVGKRIRETGRVRIHKHVQERTEVVDEPLLREDVEVERVAVNRVLTAAPEVRYEGDVMVIPVVEERYVVHKQLILKEELRVTRRRTEHRAPQEVTLRKETVEIERLPAGADRLDR